MTFLSPTVLFGLAAVSIPLIIHLLSMRKTREINFSSIRFIEELKHESIRRLQIKHWILVLLRMLLIATLVLMFARPVGEGFISGAMSGEQETRVLLIVDNSASMSMEYDGQKLLDRVKTQIPAIINAYPGQTTIDIWQTCPVQQVFSGSTRDQNIRPAVADIRFTHSTDDIWHAVDTILAKTDVREPNRECFIFSDFQYNPDQSKIAAYTDSVTVPWRFYLIGQPEIVRNLSIRTGEVVSQVRLPDHVMKVKTHIENDGTIDLDYIPVELYLDDQRVGQVVSSIKAQSGKDFGFEAFPGRTGIVHGKITLPKDDFVLDNSMTFELAIPDQIVCTIIGTSKEETYLLETALSSIDRKAEFLLINTKSSSVIDRLSLDETDVLILVNPKQVTDQAILQIQTFISNGGGLIWFMGDRYETNLESMLYAGLKLPTPIDMVILPGDNFIPAVAQDRKHPVFEDLNIRNFDAELPRVFRYVKVRSSGSQIPILSLSNGDPFLVELKHGNGHVFVFTSLLDLKWNDLPMRGFMVPLIHRMLLVLATDETNSTPVFVDEIKTIQLDRDLIHSEWSVVMPSGLSVLYIPDFNTETLNITQTNELGSYKVLSDGLPYTAFSALLAPAEYPSHRIPKEIILAQFPGDEVVRWVNPDAELSATLQDIRLGKSLWRYFLIAALILFIIETIVGRMTPAEMRTKNE